MTHVPTLLAASTPVRLAPVDFAIIVYFVLVLAIGLYLKEQVNTGEGFLMAGCEMTAWVAGWRSCRANPGSLELMGWAGNAYKCGILAARLYLVDRPPREEMGGKVVCVQCSSEPSRSWVVVGYKRSRENGPLCPADEPGLKVLHFVFKSYVQQALAEMVVTLKRDRCHCDNC